MAKVSSLQGGYWCLDTCTGCIYVYIKSEKKQTGGRAEGRLKEKPARGQRLETECAQGSEGYRKSTVLLTS